VNRIGALLIILNVSLWGGVKMFYPYLFLSFVLFLFSFSWRSLRALREIWNDQMPDRKESFVICSFPEGPKILMEPLCKQFNQ